MEILIDNRQTRIEIDLDELRRKTEKILEELGCSTAAVISIVLVNSPEIASLNLNYRGKEGPTNVLSFSQLEGETAGLQTKVLGDVVICTDVAFEDALALGYSNAEMIVYLLIHGILHLVGYDHGFTRDESVMSARLEEIFQMFFPVPIKK